MARIFTTTDAEAAAKAWLHDLTLAAGLHSNNKRSFSNSYSNFNRPDFKQEAIAVCDELVKRDFSNIDSNIRSLSRYGFYTPLTGYSQRAKYLKPEAIAKAIVYMAELLNIYWDDTVRTPYEIDEFKKTLLGSAVYKYGRYISAIKGRTTRSAGAGTTRTPGQPPKNNYKQSGPQSGNVRDLIGQPGEKVLAEGSFIYKIIGDNPQSKNTPNVFIKPLSSSGATGNTNKIFISSGNGYTDCTCYFDDPNDAQDFLDKIEKAGRVPVNVTNLRVVKNRADGNGYFLVGTEFGTCAISAKTLNEALEDITEERPFSWEAATEGYDKDEVEELHTWMRKD